MKLQLKLDQLPRLDLAGAVRLLAANAKKIEGGAAPIPVLIFAEHQYPDPKLKGKTMPLFLIGEFATEWKMEFNARKKKDASIGQCIVADGMIKLELLEGKSVKGDALKELNFIVKQARMSLSITESITESADSGASDTPATVVNTAPKNDANDTPEVKEKKAKAKDAVSKHAKRLGELVDGFKEQFNQVKSTVIPNLQNNNASRSDLVAMRKVHQSIDDFNKVYDKTHKELQKMFAGAKQNMDSQKELLTKLAKKVKAQNKSFAQKLADTFYMKKKGRPATQDEATIMQENLKMAMQHHQISEREGEERALRLKAIYATAQYRGAYFSMDDTDKVYEKMAE